MGTFEQGVRVSNLRRPRRTKGIHACPSGMTLFAVSNNTWLNVERTLNSWSRAKCSIASAGMAARGSTQLNGKSIGTRKRLACTRVSYANFARNTENSQMANELAFGPQQSRCRMLHCDRLRSHAFVWPSSLRLTE